MTIAQLFHKIFSPVEREAGVLFDDAESLAHTLEKELKMIPQPIQDLLDQIKAKLSAHSADAQTISDLQAAEAAKDAQIATLTSDGTAKDAQIADLTQEVSDVQAQLATLAGAPATPAPAPVAANGSGSADVTP